MDIKVLRNFISIAENGSICKAARALHMSQPPLSKQMKQLEDELNVQLFSRSSRGVELTEQGRLLYTHANSLIAYNDMIVRELTCENYSSIRLGMITSSVSYALDLIKGFITDTSFHFQITEKNSFELLDLLENNVIDLAFIRTPFEMSRPFQYIKMTNDHLVAVGRSAYFKDQKHTISLAELTELPLITVRRWRDYLDTTMGRFEKNPDFRFICDDNRTCLSLALNGMGVSILPDSLTHDPLHRMMIEKRSIEEDTFETCIYLVYNGSKKLDKTTHAFLLYLLDKALT